MRISITTVDYSLNQVEFDIPDDTEYQTSRRVSRTATLDGGCLISDQGFSDSDRTLKIASKLPLSVAQIATLRTFHEDYDLVVVGTGDGVFKGVIESFSAPAGKVKLNILVKERM